MSCGPGLQSPEDLTEVTRLTLKVAHLHGCRQEDSVLLHMGLSKGCSQVSFLNDVKEREPKRQLLSVYNLSSRVACHYSAMCYCLLVMQTDPGSVQERTTPGAIPGEREP